ncbi:MAG TPA: hypothetical protein VGF55_12725 [Gemmataceae bacterium]|jgi:hypothetical protein
MSATVDGECPVWPVGRLATACGRPPWYIRRLLDRGVDGVKVFKFGPARVVRCEDVPLVVAAVRAIGEAKIRRDVPAA